MHQIVGLSSRYATALYQLAAEEKQLTTLEKDILSLHSAFESSDELSAIVTDPRVSPEQMLNILLELASESSDTFKNFIKLLVQKKRTAILAEVLKDTLALYAASRGEKEVYVTSADKLTAAQKKEIEAFVIKKHEGIKKVSFNEEVQPELLAGLKVRVDSIEYDATVRGALNAMRTALKGN